MYKIIITFSLLNMMFSYGQFESNSNFKSIPPVFSKQKNKKTNPQPLDIAPISRPSVYKEEAPKDYIIGRKKEFSMTPVNDFINQGDAVRDRLNKRGGDRNDGARYRNNQDLGTFKTKSKGAKIRYRDAEFVDGDMIRISLNGVVIKESVVLEGYSQGFDLILKDGFNKIDFEALNQGTSGPNTAAFDVYDDKGNVISSSEWNLGTGFRASIIIVKDPTGN